MTKIQYLTMPGCHTCAEVKKTINEILPQFPETEFKEIDMSTSEGQEMIQKYQIMSSPGIIIDGKLFSSGGFNKEKFIDKLKSSK